MKTTVSNSREMSLELKELTKVELTVIKAGIALLGIVLNICGFQLFF